MIAMALACRPQLIVADEPTTALDVMVQAQILDLLKDLVSELGVGLLFISHDLSVLADVCDRVAVMYAGRVVESGTADQVFSDPQHPYTRALAGAFPRIGDPAARYAPAGLLGDPPDPRRAAVRLLVRASMPARRATSARRPSRRSSRSRPAVRSPASGWVHGDVTRRPFLEARDVHVEFVTRSGDAARALDGVDVVGAARRDPGHRRRVRLGQDHAGPHPDRSAAADRRRGAARGRPLTYTDRGLRDLRRRVQMVLQDAAGALNPRQTVYESVAEGIRLQRRTATDPEQRNEIELVSAAMAEAGLRPPERLFLRYPHELSGGQKQRVLIAGALALRPELILADEPVSSLDASIRGEILALLLKLRQDLGMGVVVVTHDLGLAWNIADRIAVMYLGRVVEFGTTEEVLESPRHPYTKALLSVVPEIEQLEPVVLSGEIPDPTRIPAGCRFHPRCPQLAERRGRAGGRGRPVPDPRAGGAPRPRRPPGGLSSRRGAASRDTMTLLTRESVRTCRRREV